MQRSGGGNASLEALAALRARRTATRTAGVDWFDAFYQAYITAVLAVVAFLVASSWVGEGRVTAAGISRVMADGPAVLGLVVALAVAVGLRSGSRGGPFAVEAPDVQHCLLAPLPVGAVLRQPALRQLATLALASAVVGAAVGQLAARRLPGNPAEWIVCGGVFGVTTLGAGIGAAWMTAGHRIRLWLATAVGVVVLGWATADVADLVVSPISLLGRLALWPLDFDPLALVPVGIVAGLLVFGLRSLGGISLEAAQRRSSLVGQLRFAATMRDVRTVMVLQRQLNQERARSRPWIPTRRRGGRTVILLRGWRALNRTPASRLVRMMAFGVGAALAARGAWEGTQVLLVVAGACTFLAGLEAVEPLAQEIDHPTMLDLAPADRGKTLLLHLAVPACTMIGVGVVALLAVLATGATGTGLTVAAITVVPAALAGVAGATITTVSGAFTSDESATAFMPPEAAGVGLLYRLAFPPLVAAAGFLPVLAAMRAAEQDLDPVQGASSMLTPVLLLVSVVGAYVRLRPGLTDLHAAATARGDQVAP